jgi:hypothetical protein
LERLYNWFSDASNGFLIIIARMEKFFSRQRYSPVPPENRKGGPKTALSELNRMAQMQDP